MDIFKKTLAVAMLCVALSLSACGSGRDPRPDPGSANGEDFDLDLTLELARLCLQSYQMLSDYQDGSSFSLPSPYTLVKVYLTDEPYEGQNFSGEVPIAFVATQAAKVYVVFRGTKTITEWMVDAKIAQVRYEYVGDHGLTEEGFTGVYATLHQDILATVRDLHATGDYQTLYVTGHSLGASLATLAAPVYAQESGFANPILYTFASPRTGDPIFAGEIFGPLVKTSWRIANTNDLVPKVPAAETVIFIDNRPHTYFYEHVDAGYEITFGNPVSGPTDVTDIENKHSLCNYYNTFCDRTSDPPVCKVEAGGADGCNPSS